MPAGGISPPPNASVAPIGRPRRRKAPRGWEPLSLRKSRPQSPSRPKNRLLAKRTNRTNRLNPNRNASRLKHKPMPLHPNPLPNGAPSPPIGVPGTGVGGAGTTRTALPAGLTTPPASANHGRLGPPVATRPHRLPKRKRHLPLNVLRAHRLKIPRKSPRQAFAGAMATLAWLHGFRNLK